MENQTDQTVQMPGAALEASRMPGHWLLARMGKRVLRPGGVEMTEQLLSSVAIAPTDDLMEVAPGLGATTRLLLAAGPASYVGVDRDTAAAGLVEALLDGPNRKVVQSTAADTGLESNEIRITIG